MDMEKRGISDNEETAERAIDVVAILTEGFDALADAGSVSIDHDKGPVFLTTYGWWAGITRSAQAVVTLHKAGLPHESAPIVRTVLQHALVLQWFVDTGDNAVAAVDEYADNNTRKLLQTLADANWAAPGGGFTMTAPPKPAAPNPLVSKLKNFEELCIAYQKRDVYVLFRVLSSYAHPTAIGARVYLDEQSGKLAREATSDTHSMVIQTALCLIQASHIVSHLIQGDPLRNAINRAAERLGL